MKLLCAIIYEIDYSAMWIAAHSLPLRRGTKFGKSLVSASSPAALCCQERVLISPEDLTDTCRNNAKCFALFTEFRK